MEYKLFEIPELVVDPLLFTKFYDAMTSWRHIISKQTEEIQKKIMVGYEKDYLTLILFVEGTIIPTTQGCDRLDKLIEHLEKMATKYNFSCECEKCKKIDNFKNN